MTTTELTDWKPEAYRQIVEIATFGRKTERNYFALFLTIGILFGWLMGALVVFVYYQQRPKPVYIEVTRSPEATPSAEVKFGGRLL